MKFRLGRKPGASAARAALLTLKKGDLIQDWRGDYYQVLDPAAPEGVILHVLGRRPEPITPVIAADLTTIAPTEFTQTHWHLVSNGKEVKRMARPSVPTPPKMTKEAWLKREKTKVTLTRGELEQLAQLIAAGHALIRDGKGISPKLKAAMSRLGIKTQGL